MREINTYKFLIPRLINFPTYFLPILLIHRKSASLQASNISALKKKKCKLLLSLIYRLLKTMSDKVLSFENEIPNSARGIP